MITNLGGIAVGCGATVMTALYQILAGSKQKDLKASSMQLLHAYTPQVRGSGARSERLARCLAARGCPHQKHRACLIPRRSFAGSHPNRNRSHALPSIAMGSSAAAAVPCDAPQPLPAAPARTGHDLPGPPSASV
jgi:hypothetical protein